jgi:hypothetical protein
VITAGQIGRIPSVHKLLKPIFSDAVPLESIPVEEDPVVVAKKVKDFTPPPVINFMLVFFTGLELVAWTVTFGNNLGNIINHETTDESSKTSVKLAAGMIVVWVGAFPEVTSADTQSLLCSSI